MKSQSHLTLALFSQCLWVVFSQVPHPRARMACSAVHYIGALGGKECTVDVDILVPLHLMLTY